MASRFRNAFALALLAGLLVAMSGCGASSESDEDRIAGVIHRLLLAAGTEGTDLLDSFPGRLPDDLPATPPIYPDAEILVSSRQPAPRSDFDSPASGESQSIIYFIVLDSTDSRTDVFSFYEDALDDDPWQIQTTFSTEQLDTLQFFNSRDIDIGGVVSIAEGGADGRTSVLISLQDTGASLENAPGFELQPSLPLPRAFPSDVPLVEGATITGTAFFREPGLQSFLIELLTTSSQDNVIEFYRGAFQDNGWTVQDTTAFGLEGRIDFRSADGNIQGDVSAERFVRARQYTEVVIKIQLNPARGAREPANQEPADDEDVDDPDATPEDEAGELQPQPTLP